MEKNNMDNIFQLAILYDKYDRIRSKTVAEVSYRLGKYDGRRFEKILDDIKLALLSAPDQLDNGLLGSCGVLDEQMVKKMKYGLYRMEFLCNEIKVILRQGTNETYWRKVAKDVLGELPLFPNTEDKRQCSVKQVNLKLIIDKNIDGITSLLLLESSNAAFLSVVPMDKSLARVAFDNQRIRNHFDITCWVCISELCTINILQKIVEEFDEASFCGVQESNSLNWLLAKLEENFGDKRYLLVLDQSSEEGCPEGHNWFDLLGPLLSVSTKAGSKVLITSSVKCVDPDSHSYNLHATSIMASILSFAPANLKQWKSFNDTTLGCINNPVQSFHSAVGLMERLDADLQPLLAYSSLFPLDYKFNEVGLQQLWEVQGFLDSVVFKRRFDKCFEKLLNMKYFLKENITDHTGVRVWYRALGLMHEVVKHLTKDEYRLVDKPTMDVVDARVIQHVSIIIDSNWKPPAWLYDAKQLKSLLFLPSMSCRFITIPKIGSILANLKALQALDLAILMNCGSCLNIIGELNHLRYLSLGVSVEYLPECITNLQFLQTLDLRHSKIRKLPEDFHKLAPRLRHLYTGDKLVDLPPKFEKLTKLQTLDVFIVGKNNGLATLTCFIHLAGKLKIRYHEGRDENTPQKNPTNLERAKLDDLLLEWPTSFHVESTTDDILPTKDVMELEFLQLPFTLKSLAIKGWMGDSFPKWAMDQLSCIQSNLVSIHIADSIQCKYLPSFSKLGCLKFLQLWRLDTLEWIDISDDKSVVSSEIPYFPSLESLTLVNLPQLKGWSRVQESCLSSNLPRLFDLKVSGCPVLMSMPRMPSLKSLETCNIHQNMLHYLLSDQTLRSLKLTNMSIPEPLPRGFDRLTTLEELSLCWLYSVRMLPKSIGDLSRLQKLVLHYLPDLVLLPESLGMLSALQHIEIRYCPRLKQLPQSFANLKSICRLEIKECVHLQKRCHQPDGQDLALIQHIPNVYLG